ncbi:MAG: glycosyltransferase family 4 protein [Rhodothermales bacterium]
MKIIQVPRRFVASEWGGTETTILQTSRALRSSGHDVQIFTSCALSRHRQENIQGVPVRRFSYTYPFFGLSDQEKVQMDKKGGNLLSLPLLWSLVREPGVDLLHAHTGKRVGGMVRTAARMRKIPYVVTLHGGFFEVPQAEMEQMLAPIQNHFEWGRLFGALLGSRRVLEDAAALLCVGGDEYQAAKRELPNQRVELLPNGVDCRFFSQGDGMAFRDAYGIAPDRRIVLCVSRIDYQKNQIGLVEAIAKASAQHPRLHLVLLGPVTVASYHQRLLDRIDELGLAQRVTLIPGLEADDPLLTGAYHAAEIFCLPSLHEPFGIVILEAWAAGLPVIASRVGGIPSFTRDSEDIIHVEPGDADEFGRRIAGLLDQPDMSARLAATGRKKAELDYDWSIISRRMLALYDEIAGLG